MLKQILFQIHWALGISAGLLLAIIGVTGAMMSFEDEIMAALSRNASAVVARDAPRLTVPQLVERFYATQPPRTTLASLTVDGDPARMAEVKYTLGTYDERAIHYNYIDPYDGTLRGDKVGRGFFEKVREIHRWMLLPDRGADRLSIGLGRWVTMITAISLVYFALSGLYLRWPRRALDWRAWFRLDVRMSGRNLYRSLHATIGTWLLLAYLFSALTGMWWSFGDLKSWYRDAVSTAMTGHAFTQGEGDGGVTVPHDMRKAWAAFQGLRPTGFASVEIEIREEGGPVRFRTLPAGARHNRAWDVIRIEPDTGKVVTNNRYGQRAGQDIPWGESIIGNMLAVHTGNYFGTAGRIILLVSSLAMPLFTITGLLLYLDRRRKKKALKSLDTSHGAIVGDGRLLVIHASQTRTAETLARQTAAAFTTAGRPVDLVPMDKLGADALAKAETALFVVSTYGDGEPPDGARSFVRRHLGHTPDLSHLDTAVLALGDREYPNFCSFGHQVAGWLEACGARPLCATVEVDGSDRSEIVAWERCLATLGAAAVAIQPDAVVYERWRLAERRRLNPDSPGAPAYHVALEPVGGHGEWEAGDIAIIQPAPVSATARQLEQVGANGEGASASAPSPATPTAKLPDREYSIASIPAMGRLEFIVRQLRKDDGTLGLGSGWLTHTAALGEEMELRLRSNPSFRAVADERPMILIGNGTGLAGLIAHIRQRSGRDAAPMWLLFGERTRTHDSFHADELHAHQASGVLARIDWAFSRDEGDGRYVQDLVRGCAGELRRWVADGAAIYVCGSLHGMAPAVDARLREVLGDDGVDALIDQGRYCRDIY